MPEFEFVVPTEEDRDDTLQDTSKKIVTKKIKTSEVEQTTDDSNKFFSEKIDGGSCNCEPFIFPIIAS